MHRRTFGLEHEYGIMLRTPEGCTLGVQPGESAFLDAVAGPKAGQFLANGSRVYVDTGGHPEYATAECSTPFEAAAQSRAGDEIIMNMAERARPTLERKLDTPLVIELYKNNVDSTGLNTYGCHENYLAERQIGLAVYVERLAPFLLTRSVLTGAGSINPTPDGPRFLLSQRATHLFSALSSSSTKDRSLIHSRDEPLCSEDRWRRLHVLAGDTNLSDEVTAFKMASTSLVLRVIEASTRRWRDFTPESVPQALLAISSDLSANGRYRLASGRSISASAVQAWYCERARQLVDVEGGYQWEIDCLDRWQELIGVLGQGPAPLAGFADWATKLLLLRQLIDRYPKGIADPRVALADLYYHDINPRKGLARRAEVAGKLSRLVDDQAVMAATVSPPQTTRAALRGWFITEAHSRNILARADWKSVSILNGGTTLRLDDPFVCHSPEFQAEAIAQFNAIDTDAAPPPELVDTGLEVMHQMYMGYEPDDDWEASLDLSDY